MYIVRNQCKTDVAFDFDDDIPTFTYLHISNA
jgi:hypothetical protein